MIDGDCSGGPCKGTSVTFANEQAVQVEHRVLKIFSTWLPDDPVKTCWRPLAATSFYTPETITNLRTGYKWKIQ